MIASLFRATEVMELFSRPPHALGLTEVARQTGMERSAVQRVLYTLHAAGWLHKDPVSRRYSPSIRFLEGAFGYLVSDPLMQNASPHVISLSRETRETVNVARLDGTDIVYVSRLPARRAAYVSTVVGRRLPALNTSSGRAVLSTRSEAEIDEACATWPLGTYLATTTTDRTLIRDQIHEARAVGYAVAEEQLLPNELDIAAPIRDLSGVAIGSVQIAVSNLRWDRARLRTELAPALVDASKAITPPQDTRD
ncbi:IclR family transcriptional regulator [Acidimangrovimonas sediminis]|uniref:IclR family transcriptional regulator n=1 Tax=Acidimangrovimonas sediminis TaxID=2056283 RepID=UPI001304B607|nr:IclR family transcriptional regulator [Acidimangrovimonas sediminis]